MNDLTPEKTERSKLAKWSRRGFIGAGVLAGGGLLIGIGVRPGNPVGLQRLPYTNQNPSVQTFRHAVAIDARAPQYDGGIITRLDCVVFGIVVVLLGFLLIQ